MKPCEACGIEVEGDWKKHCKSKGHRYKKPYYDKCQRSVYVGELPLAVTTAQLKEYFTQFVPVVDITRKNKYAFVEFHLAESCNKVLNVPKHSLLGHKLTISRRRYLAQPLPHKQSNTDIVAEQKADKQDRIETLKALKGYQVQEQLLMLENQMRLTEYNRNVRLRFKDYLQAILQMYVPEVRLTVYGSTASGLGMGNCDVDIMLHYAPDISRKGLPPAPPLPCLPKGPLKIIGGRVTASSLCNLSLADQIAFFTSVLRRSDATTRLDRIQPIPRARVPLIKCHHKDAGFEFDLTFGANRLAIHNTRLIQLLIDLDPRVRPLVFAIKMWAKQIGENLSPNVCLSSYSLMMMVYTYLQNTTSPVLPTMEALVRLCGPADWMVCQDWDCTFSTDIPRIHQTLLTTPNTASIHYLLRGFFKFYSNFNLLRSVICPRTGHIRDLVYFRGIVNSSPQLEPFKINFLNIQDPFELCHNTAGNINLASARHISASILQAASAMEEHSLDWDLLTFIPLQAAPLLPSQGEESLLMYQEAFVPSWLLAGQSADTIVNAWYTWAVQQLESILKILRIEHTVVNFKKYKQEGKSEDEKRMLEKNQRETVQGEKEQSGVGKINKSVKKLMEIEPFGGTEPNVLFQNYPSETKKADSVPTFSFNTQSSMAAAVSKIFDPKTYDQLGKLPEGKHPLEMSPETSLKKVKLGTDTRPLEHFSAVKRTFDPKTYDKGSSQGDCDEDFEDNVTRPQYYRLDHVFEEERTLQCSTMYQLWNGRKPMRKMVNDNPLDREMPILLKEEKVSELLLAQSAPADEPYTFRICIKRYRYGHETHIVMSGGELEGFLKSFVQKIMKGILYPQSSQGQT